MGDVRVVQRSQYLGFTLESREPFGVVSQCIRENFDCDVSLQRRVRRPIDLAHAAFAERRDDFVGTEAGAWRERHSVVQVSQIDPSSLERLEPS
jgi:hypothetical protein